MQRMDAPFDGERNDHSMPRNGEPVWQPLMSTRNVLPPTVELLDGKYAYW